jgi:hypothetical protein
MRQLDRATNKRRYMPGDAIKLAVVLDHKANLSEVRVVFAHAYDENATVIGRGTPHPISERGADGSMRSRLDAEITLPRGVTPGSITLSESATRRRGAGSDTSQKSRDCQTPSRAPLRCSENPKTHPR